METARQLIQRLHDDQAGIGVIEGCLAGLSHPGDLRDFLMKYARFNRLFAGAVACLAGQVHFRTDLFSTNDDLEDGDRSAEIATRVFYAAEDEYSALHNASRVTHRSIAQKFVADVIQILGSTGTKRTFANPDWSKTLYSFDESVKRGYSTCGFASDADAIRALGFHAASEWLADVEFNHIQSYMERAHSDLVTELRRLIGPGAVNGFYWIEVHSAVEAEHGEMALQAIDLAFKFGPASIRESFVDLVHEGFASFGRVQRDFFEWAARSPKIAVL
jgi:hypothetical protein